jgi:hypothetical protein
MRRADLALFQIMRQSAFRVDAKRGEWIAVALQKRFNLRRLIIDDEAIKRNAAARRASASAPHFRPGIRGAMTPTRSAATCGR